MEGISLSEDEDEETSNVTTLSVTDEANAEVFFIWAAYVENEDTEGTEIEGYLEITLSEMESF